jgi:hypothetical protein
VVASFVAGCSTFTPPRYAVSMDNNRVLKRLKGKKVVLAILQGPEKYDSTCRAMGPIEAKDGLTIPQYIQKAFNDEFQFGEVYDGKEGVQLSGKVDKLAFSSFVGITNGWWDIGITLKSPEGRSVSVVNRYNFKSGFDAFMACSQTAQALAPAVQDLIYKMVTHGRFVSLLQ